MARPRGGPHSAAEPVARMALPSGALAVLLHLEVDGPQSVGDIAHRAGMRPGQVTSWLYFLCDNGHACMDGATRRWEAADPPSGHDTAPKAVA